MDKKEKNFWLSNGKRAREYQKSNLQYSVKGGKVGRAGSNSKARHTPVWLNHGDSVITEKQQRAIRKKGIKLPRNKLPMQRGSAPRGTNGTKALLLPNEIVLTAAQARSIEQQGGKLPTWGLQSTAGPIKKKGDKGGRYRKKKKKKSK